MNLQIAHGDIIGKTNFRHKQFGGVAPKHYTARMLLRLREIRKDRGLTQVQLAEKAGLSQAYYNEIENGKKQLNQSTLLRLSKALGVSPSEVLVDDENVDRVGLMALYDQLTPEQQALVRQMAENFVAAGQSK